MNPQRFSFVTYLKPHVLQRIPSCEYFLGSSFVLTRLSLRPTRPERVGVGWGTLRDVVYVRDLQKVVTRLYRFGNIVWGWTKFTSVTEGSLSVLEPVRPKDVDSDGDYPDCRPLVVNRREGRRPVVQITT